jgi:protein involved in polysaccharide export with SLBB domain
VPPDARITSLVALAGNLTANADARRVVLVRKDGQAVVVDLVKLLLDPASPENTSAADIDMFVVPPEQDLVVTGAVVRPGVYRAGTEARLLEAIAMAGGPGPDSDHRGVIVVMRDGQTVTVDVDEASTHPESEANVRVSEASMVIVGRVRNEVSVTGEVTRPLVIPTLVPVPLSNCLAQAGGLTKSADPRRVQIIRSDGSEETVDASQLVGRDSGSGTSAGKVNDPLLDSGDSVVVGRRYARVVVLGAVNDPGSYDFNEGDRVVDAIALAGGFVEGGKKPRMRETSIIRRNGDKVTLISLDMAQALHGDEVLINEQLQDRDIVFVPQGKTPPWRDIVDGLIGVSSWVRIFLP